MKRLPLILVASALAVSLWFNWHPRRTPPPVPTPAAPAAILPGTLGEMDFSGTALADEAWQLPPAELPTPIPGELPRPAAADSLPPPPAPPPEWNPDDIRLAPEGAR